MAFSFPPTLVSLSDPNSTEYFLKYSVELLKPYPIDHGFAVFTLAIDDGIVVNFKSPTIDEDLSTSMTEGLLALLPGNIAGINIF